SAGEVPRRARRTAARQAQGPEASGQAGTMTETRHTLTLAARENPDRESWRWQLQNSVRTLADLQRALDLTPDELAGAERAERGGFPFAIPPYYLDLCDKHDPACPIRRQVVPHAFEG